MRWGIVGFGWVARDFMAPGIAAAGGHVVADLRSRCGGAGGGGADRGASARRHRGLCCARTSMRSMWRRRTIRIARRSRPVWQGGSSPCSARSRSRHRLADAEAMAAAARRHGVLLGTAFDQRFHPAHVAIRRAIESGTIGTPTALRIVYACWLDRTWSAAQAPGDNWRIDPARAGGGAIVDLAPHGLDLAAMLLGEPVVIALTGHLQRRVHDYDVEDGGMLVGRTQSRRVGRHAQRLQRSRDPAAPAPRDLRHARPDRRHRHDGAGRRGPGSRSSMPSPANAGRLRSTPRRHPSAAQARAFAAAVRGEPHDVRHSARCRRDVPSSSERAPRHARFERQAS